MSRGQLCLGEYENLLMFQLYCNKFILGARRDFAMFSLVTKEIRDVLHLSFFLCEDTLKYFCFN